MSFGTWHINLVNLTSPHMRAKFVAEYWWNWTANVLPNAMRRRLFVWHTKFCEIDLRCQFHQHFTNEVFVQRSFQQLFLVTFCLWQKFVRKTRAYNVDEIDYRRVRDCWQPSRAPRSSQLLLEAGRQQAPRGRLHRLGRTQVSIQWIFSTCKIFKSPNTL